MKEFVEMRDVRKIYRMGEVEIAAADGIDFQIKKGEFAVVVGPSGAGKTTVLNILGGMDTATSGEVWIDGKNIVKYSPRQLTSYRRDDIGFVFQFYNLIPNLTAEEPMEMLGKYGRMRQRYLEQHKPILFQTMLLNGELTAHLREIDKTANEQLNSLMRVLAKEAGATEQLKATDQLAWVGLMNNLKAQAEELILTELVYS